MILAENETLRSLVAAISCLCEGAQSMSRYQYLAQVTEIATQIAETKKVSADDVFRQLAAVPRDKLAETIRKIV